MSDVQNPSLPDLMLPEYTPDPELLAREKAIYDRIMKSPSQRAKERTAEMWEERYGVKPESGKLRRIFAGLGEVARGISAGAKYQSIPDMAREEAMKEYQAEVPNLNRELATISGQKNAALSAMQRQNSAAMKYAVDSLRAATKGAVDEAQAAAIRAKFPKEVQRLAAQAEAAEAQANLTNIRATNELSSGGRSGLVGDAAWLQAQNPELASKILGMRNAVGQQDALFKLMGNPRVYQTPGSGGTRRTTTTMKRVKVGVGPDGSELYEDRPYTSTTTGSGASGGEFNPAAGAENIRKLQQVFAGAQAPITKALTPPPEPASPQEISDPATGTTYKFIKPAKPQKTAATVQDGRVVGVPKIDPKIPETYRTLLPDVDVDNPEAFAQFAGQELVRSSKKLTPQEESENRYRLEGIRLAKIGIDEFLSGDLDLTAGIPGRLVNWGEKLLRKPKSGKIMTETTTLRNLGEYLRSISGLATTVPEVARAKEIMPTTADQPETLLIKAFQAAMIEAQHGWLKSLNIPLEAKTKIFEDNPELLTAPKTAVNAAMKHLSAAAAAKKNGQKTYRIPGGDTDYTTETANKLVWDMLTGVSRDMQNAMYKSFPDGIGGAPPARFLRKKK